MGAASRQNLTAMLPPQQFHCLLDELPLHLIPAAERGFLSLAKDRTRRLILNPLCSILNAGEVPRELDSHRDLLAGFVLQGTIAWVRDPAMGSLRPFWLGTRVQAVIAQVRAEGGAAESLPEVTVALLAASQILVAEDYAERRAEDWKKISRASAKEFGEKNYTPIRGLIHPFHIAALRRYYRFAIRKGLIRLGDEQSSRRYVAHNEPVARFFHHQIASVVGRIVGEPVKPSYVYLASYLSGAELKKHIDREQCEFSVTLCLDFSPEPETATPWPIRVDTPSGSVGVHQALGDGLVYRGTKMPHYRDALGEGQTSTSIFLHYVPADFSGPLD